MPDPPHPPPPPPPPPPNGDWSPAPTGDSSAQPAGDWPAPATGEWPAGPAQPPTPGQSRSTWLWVLVIGAALLVVLVVLMLAAFPAFLNQRDRAREAELASAVRNAAIEVEVAATQLGGRYDAIGDFDGLVSRELARYSDAVVLDAGSSLTGAEPDRFSICAEHRDLDGSIAYVSDQGGLTDYRDTPCP